MTNDQIPITKEKGQILHSFWNLRFGNWILSSRLELEICHLVIIFLFGICDLVIGYCSFIWNLKFGYCHSLHCLELVIW
jgi:hypothetical protein